VPWSNGQLLWLRILLFRVPARVQAELLPSGVGGGPGGFVPDGEGVVAGLAGAEP
jgi:hypothetical protein